VIKTFQLFQRNDVMKFRVSMKGILWTWSILILMLIGLGYNAYDRLRPEAFVQLATEQIQKNIPNSELVVGSVDYSFSLDFNIKLKQVTVVRNQTQIAKVGELELKIPWWLLVTHRGTAQVNIGQVEILLSSTDVKKIAGPESDEGEATEEAKIDIEVPSYLSNARFTLRAKDVALKNEDASRTYLQISKLLVREFALRKNSAFEIKLPVWFEHNNQTFSSEIWLFGDLTPDNDKWSFNYTGDFRTKDIEAKVSFDDVALEGSINLGLPHFTITSQTSFMIDKEEKGTSHFSLNQESWSLDLDFSALPLEFLALFEKEIFNDYFNKFDGDAQGKIVLKQKFSEDNFLLEGNLTFPGKFSFAEVQQEGTWNLTFDNNLWVNRFENDFIKFSRENLIAFNESEFLEVRETFEFRNMSFTDVFKIIPQLDKVSKSEVPEQKSVLLQNITREEDSFNGQFELSSNHHAFNYSGQFSDGKQSVNFQLVHDVDYSLDVKIQSFKMVGGFDFFAPWITGEGMLNLEFSGRDLNQFPLESWKLVGTIEGEKLEGLIPSYLANIWREFQRTPVKQELNLFVNPKSSQLKLVDRDDNATLNITLNRDLSAESTASLVFPPKSKKKKEVKKISLGFLKKDS